MQDEEGAPDGRDGVRPGEGGAAVLLAASVALQWCVDGRCESTSRRAARTDNLRHNAQAGGWSGWTR